MTEWSYTPTPSGEQNAPAGGRGVLGRQRYGVATTRVAAKVAGLKVIPESTSVVS